MLYKTRLTRSKLHVFTEADFHFYNIYNVLQRRTYFQRKKDEICLFHMTKTPISTEHLKKVKVTIQKRHKNVQYKTKQIRCDKLPNIPKIYINIRILPIKVKSLPNVCQYWSEIQYRIGFVHFLFIFLCCSIHSLSQMLHDILGHDHIQ